MATHSSVLVWRILGMGEPGGRRLWGHDLAAAAPVLFLLMVTFQHISLPSELVLHNPLDQFRKHHTASLGLRN